MAGGFGRGARILGAAFLALASLGCDASVNVYSETSHFIWGGVFAGVCTWAVDRWTPDYAGYRGWIGFGISSTAGIVSEVLAPNGFSRWDAGSNMAGAAVGAAVTSGYVLAPVVRTDAAGKRQLGVVFSARF
jgi:hypothetical protein